MDTVMILPRTRFNRIATIMQRMPNVHCFDTARLTVRAEVNSSAAKSVTTSRSHFEPNSEVPTCRSLSSHSPASSLCPALGVCSRSSGCFSLSLICAMFGRGLKDRLLRCEAVARGGGWHRFGLHGPMLARALHLLRSCHFLILRGAHAQHLKEI